MSWNKHGADTTLSSPHSHYMNLLLIALQIALEYQIQSFIKNTSREIISPISKIRVEV